METLEVISLTLGAARHWLLRRRAPTAGQAATQAIEPEGLPGAAARRIDANFDRSRKVR